MFGFDSHTPPPYNASNAQCLWGYLSGRSKEKRYVTAACLSRVPVGITTKRYERRYPPLPAVLISTWNRTFP
jgi:hypothetical protein